MAKLLIYLDDERHQDLKELAHHHNTSMADLIRFAIEETFEDDLDALRGKRRLEAHLADPSSGSSLDDYLKERGIVLPSRIGEGSETRPEAATG